jgi:hypothetical protein
LRHGQRALDFVPGATITPHVGDGDLSRRHGRVPVSGKPAFQQGKKFDQFIAAFDLIVRF